MAHPHRPWNEQFEDDDRRRRRREDEERSDFRERDPQRFGRFGREDEDFDSPGRFGERERGDDDRGRRGGYSEQQRFSRESGFGRGREGREGWESYEEWQQPRRLAGYYEGHRFGGGQGAGRYTERERWQPYEGGAQDFERGFQDWQRRGESGGQRFGQGGYGQGVGESQRYGQGFGESQRYGSESGRGLGRSDQDRGFAGRGPKNYKRSDQRIQEDVCERLTSDPRIDATEIIVEVKNGEVTLDGSVNEREMKRRAEDCVEYVNGVNQVHNRLRVSGQGQQAQSGQGQTGQGQTGQGQAGSESWGRSGSEQRADQSGTTSGRSGRTT